MLCFDPGLFFIWYQEQGSKGEAGSTKAAVQAVVIFADRSKLLKLIDQKGILSKGVLKADRSKGF